MTDNRPWKGQKDCSFCCCCCLPSRTDEGNRCTYYELYVLFDGVVEFWEVHRASILVIVLGKGKKIAASAACHAFEDCKESVPTMSYMFFSMKCCFSAT